MRKTNSKIRVIALALSLVCLAGTFSLPSFAHDIEPNNLAAMDSSLDPNGRIHRYLKGIANKNIWSYNRLNVTIGQSTLSVKGFVADGVIYIPARSAASAISGSTYSYDSSTRTSILRAPGLEMVMGDGCYVTYANDRALFNTTPNVIMSDGRLYIPATVFAKAVGMKLSVTDSVKFSGSYSPIISGAKFYRDDEVFWLARIIHAESRGEALLGQIAVGNVVLNRVKSAYYPNTIYGVIFDRKYGVQFSPILDGTIYNTPGYTATLAAKICLEGYDVSQGAFFFLNTALATSSWIPKNRAYAFTIGNHDFYY